MCLLFLGVPRSEQPTGMERFRKKTVIPSDLGRNELEDFIANMYPQVPNLQRYGFTFAKCLKNRQLVSVKGTTVAELRIMVNRGQLFIIPNRDLLPISVSV